MTKSNATDQREALNQSEKDASAQQPDSYKDEATREKVVRIDPITPGDDAIKGIDPKDDRNVGQTVKDDPAQR